MGSQKFRDMDDPQEAEGEGRLTNPGRPNRGSRENNHKAGMPTSKETRKDRGASQGLETGKRKCQEKTNVLTSLFMSSSPPHSSPPSRNTSAHTAAARATKIEQAQADTELPPAKAKDGEEAAAPEEQEEVLWGGGRGGGGRRGAGRRKTPEEATCLFIFQKCTRAGNFLPLFYYSSQYPRFHLTRHQMRGD